MIELPEQLRALSGRIEAVIYLAAAGERGARRPLFLSDATRLIFGLEPDQLAGEDELLLAHVHPEDLARLRAELEAAAGSPFAPLKYRLVHHDGRVLWCRETMVAVESEGVPAGLVAGVVADVSELELPRRALEASLSAQGNRDAMLALCDILAQGLALSHTVFVDLRSGERQLTTHGPLGARLQARWDQPGAIEPWAAQVAHEERFASVSDGAESLLSAELRALCPGARLGFAIPIAGGDGSAGGGATGALLGLAPRPLSLHPMHRRMLEALGRQAGLSLQRAGLVEALQRTGRERQQLADALVRAHEEERGRLARELHDGAGQTLTAVAIQLDLAERRSNAEARPALEAARKQVEQTLEELRRLAHALRPAALDGLGLGEALAEMARSLEGGAGGLEVRVEVAGPLPALDPQISTALFRVAQAALTNVVRHARAARATLRLQASHAGERTLLSLEVVDDGRGFTPGGLQHQHHQRHGGMGLLAMRERTVALGGRFSLRSEPGGGAQVRAEFDV